MLVKEENVVWGVVIGISIGIFIGLWFAHSKPVQTTDNRSSLEAECQEYGGC